MVMSQVKKAFVPLLVGIAISVTAMLAFGAENGVGSVDGRVINGTTERPAVGLEVNLLSFDPVSGMRGDVYTATTDADGKFQFDSVRIVPRAKYVAAAKYENVVYYSNAGVFSGTSRLSLPFRVFDPTTDPSSVEVARAIWTVDFGRQKLVIGEMYIFSNTTNRTYIGDGKGKAVLRFRLPAGASKVEFREGKIGKRFQKLDAETYADTFSLLPGEFSRQITLKYTMPYAGRKVSLAYPILYPVDNLNVLVEDIGEYAWLDIPAKESRRTLRGVDYIAFASNGVPRGEVVRLELRRLPGEPRKPLPWWAYAGMLILGSALGIGAAFAGRGRLRS